MARWCVTLHGATGSDERPLSLHPCTLQNTSPGQIMIAIAKPRATRIRNQYQIKLCLQDGASGCCQSLVTSAAQFAQVGFGWSFPGTLAWLTNLPGRFG